MSVATPEEKVEMYSKSWDSFLEAYHDIKQDRDEWRNIAVELCEHLKKNTRAEQLHAMVTERTDNG